ncbi:MAG: hypothetical protein LBP20_04780 [Treponema sp.]|jgi:hypothetical protein|nr:hypothetical protein [Treponema sp.]
MKKSLFALGLLASILFISCKQPTGTLEQKYDMMEYVVSSSDYAKCEIQMETYGDGEPTEAILNQFEQWITVNTSAQVTPSRDLTKGQITDALLQVTSLSREQINTLFQKADSVGKSFAVLVFQDGNRDVLFIDKL